MSADNLISESSLKKWTGFKQRAALERWLKKKEIFFLVGRDGEIITTTGFIEQAKSKKPEFEFG